MILTFPESWESEGMTRVEELKGNEKSDHLCGGDGCVGTRVRGLVLTGLAPSRVAWFSCLDVTGFLDGPDF